MSYTNNIPESTGLYNMKSEIMDMEIIRGTGQILSDKKTNGDERPWTKHKKDSLKLHKLYEIARRIDTDCITPSSFMALSQCASFLLYRIGVTGEKKLKNADFCRARLCPMCNWRKSLKMFGQATRITERILEKYPTTRFIFVTLTVKNCASEDLENTIDTMNKGFSRLTAKGNKFGATASFKTRMLGYMRAIEVTYNRENDTYHPHIHVIFAVKADYFTRAYIKQAEWQVMWQACLGLEYEPLVNVQAIKATKNKGLVGAVAETAKYPVKMDGIIDLPEGVAVPVIITLSKALRAKRLVTFGGLFADVRKELKLDDLESGDLIHADESEVPINEVSQMLFRFHARVGCYVC